MNKNQLPFRILTLTVFIVLLLPVMVKEGLFIDGLLYSSVSRNLANGLGTFWFPVFDQVGFAGLKTFNEHPPLYFAIQSVFFRVFGDGYFTEKLHSLLAAVITGLLIILFWKKINRNCPEYKKLEWLPVLLWIIIPIVFYIYQHNLIEGTMSIFTIASVYFIWSSLADEKFKIIKLFIAGLFIFLATFTKGVPGFFPVVVVFLWWLVKKGIGFGRMAFYSMVLLLIPALIYGLMVISSEQALASLSLYMNERLLGRISSAPTVDSRFHVMGQWVLKMLPVFGMTVIVLTLDKFRSFRKINDNPILKDVLFFMLVGFAGTLPLMLTLVQRSFYFVPALPFFAIGFALILAPVFQRWTSSMKSGWRSWLTRITMIILAAVITITVLSIGKPGRDKDMLHDVHLIGKYVPDHAMVSIPVSMHNRWTLRTYMVRYYNITLNSSGENFDYLLLEKSLQPHTPGWQKVELSLLEFDLYQRKQRDKQD